MSTPTDLYPCDYRVIAMGLNQPGFEDLTVMLVRRHCPDLGEGAVSSRPSRAGKYLSVSVTIRAQSRAQLDALYADLDREPRILTRL